MSNSKYQIFDDFLDDPDEVLEFSNYYTAKQYAEYNKSESITFTPRTTSYVRTGVNKINMFDVKAPTTFYKHLLEQTYLHPCHTLIKHTFSCHLSRIPFSPEI